MYIIFKKFICILIPISLILSVILITILLLGCGKDDSPTGSSNCVSVTQGIWEFEVKNNNITILHFVDGQLNQNGCHISYDRDNFFSGSIEGTFWSGSNTIEGFIFEGNFEGESYKQFKGTVTILSNNLTADMIGNSVN